MGDLRIVQANLARAFRASENLNIYQGENSHQISVIQEPYLYQGKLIGFPLTHRVIAASGNAKVATVVHDSEIKLLPIKISQKLVATSVTWQHHDLLIVNCYAPPSEDIKDTITEIEELFAIHQFDKVLLLGDFNAKSTVWGGQKTDDRGKALSEFLIHRNLYVRNDAGSLPTFETKNGRSWIDLTIIMPNLISEMQEWNVLEVPTASDHRYIGATAGFTYAVTMLFHYHHTLVLAFVFILVDICVCFLLVRGVSYY